MEDTRDTYTIVITLNDYKGMKLSFVHSNYFIRLFIAGDKMYIPVILVQLRFVQISLRSFVLLKLKQERLDRWFDLD